MSPADAPDHGLVLGEDVDAGGQGPLLGPGGHRRHEAPHGDVLIIITIIINVILIIITSLLVWAAQQSGKLVQ